MTTLAPRTRPLGDEPHPMLRRLFKALSKQGVSWTLLRLPSSLSAPAGDVDVLVAPEHVDAFRTIARGVGFVPLPGWESPPNLIFVRYERASRQWVLVDVTTTIFSSSVAGEQVPELTRAVLRNRKLSHGLAVPAEMDAFWLLLVHCLLDKGGVPARYRERLVKLAPRGWRSVLGAAVVSRAGDRWTPAGVALAVRQRRWEEIEQLGAGLMAELRRRKSTIKRIRELVNRGRAAVRKPLLLRRRRGVSVALIGPNGVGKSTLAAGLQRDFPFDSRVVYMGLWTRSSGGAGNALVALLARPLRVWRRYLLAELHRARGRLVIFDRYVYEAALPSKPPFEGLKRPYHWFLRHAVPRPDAVIVLDVPGAVAYGRKQENPPEELEWERRVYRALASRVPEIELVDASRDAESVRADAMAIVWRRMHRRFEPTRPRRRPKPGNRRRPRGRRLAEACALIPSILSAESDSLPQSVRGALIANSRWTITGRAVIFVARPGEPPSAVVKLPATTEGARELRKETDALIALHADDRLGEWRRLLPRPLASGSVLGRPYSVESVVPGRSAFEGIEERAARLRVVEAAAEAIGFLHQTTASNGSESSELAARWVDARLDDLARAGACRHPLFRSRAVRLREELQNAMEPGMLSTGWVHGDYWPGNVLVSTGALDLCGIVDWGAADPADLAMHDLLHFILSMRRVETGEELGQIVRQLLRSGLAPDARRVLRRHGGWPPDGFTSERQALLMYWLRQVALHARQHESGADPRYVLWEMRNVHAVLGAQ